MSDVCVNSAQVNNVTNMNLSPFVLVFIFSDALIHTLGDGEAADGGQVQQHIPGSMSSTSVSKVEPDNSLLN